MSVTKWMEDILNDEKIENKLEAINKELPNYFIPKDKYNEQAAKLKEKESELDATAKQLEEQSKQVEELNKQVQSLSGAAGEKEKLQEQLEKIKSEHEQFKSEAEKRLDEVKKRQAIERGLRDSKANPETIDLLIDKFDFGVIELDKDGNVKDFDKHLEPIKEARKSLFAEENITGDRPGEGDNTDPSTYKAKYEQALKEGNRREAIKIKQEAYNKGEKFI